MINLLWFAAEQLSEAHCLGMDFVATTVEQTASAGARMKAATEDTRRRVQGEQVTGTCTCNLNSLSALAQLLSPTRPLLTCRSGLTRCYSWEPVLPPLCWDRDTAAQAPLGLLHLWRRPLLHLCTHSKIS